MAKKQRKFFLNLCLGEKKQRKNKIKQRKIKMFL
jgi:hypothetical protein